MTPNPSFKRTATGVPGLFFFSREETRIHAHVAHPDGEAKFWLTPPRTLGCEHWVVAHAGSASAGRGRSAPHGD